MQTVLLRMPPVAPQSRIRRYERGGSAEELSDRLTVSNRAKGRALCTAFTARLRYRESGDPFLDRP